MLVPQHLTSQEKVLYKASYNFAIEVLKLTGYQAQEMAEQKILKKRALGKKIKFRH